MTDSLTNTRRSFLSLSTLAVLPGLFLSSPLLAADQDAGAGLGEAIVAGSPHLLFRYRYEFVSDDKFADNANASTLRLRLNYGTGKWSGWSGFGEFDYVGHVLQDDFNSGGGTSPGKSRYPVVADPDGADLNQLYLEYTGLTGSRLRFGRQRILLDNQRFVGGVGWRQNEQTYDGVSLVYKGMPKTEISYTFVTQVNRIFGEGSSVGRDNQNTHLLNGRIGLNDHWKLTPYYYYIDSDKFAAFSTSTLGARISGELALPNGALKLVGELATQSDAADNPVDYDAQYLHLSANWAMKSGLALGLGFESLGGDASTAGGSFRMPLATLHAFQGWADQFLGTPGAGMEDVYVSAKVKVDKWGILAVYHDFSADDGSANWGNEFDLVASRSLGKRYSILLKAAFFSADSAAFRDVSKFWLQLTASY